jgi:hypothetical protein
MQCPPPPDMVSDLTTLLTRVLRALRVFFYGRHASSYWDPKYIHRVWEPFHMARAPR